MDAKNLRMQDAESSEMAAVLLMVPPCLFVVPFKPTSNITIFIICCTKYNFLAIKKMFIEEKDKLIKSFDIQQDKEQIYSIRGTYRLGRQNEKGQPIPYALNVIDRDYLV